MSVCEKTSISYLGAGLTESLEVNDFEVIADLLQRQHRFASPETFTLV